MTPIYKLVKRMNKTFKYARYGALFGGTILGLNNIIEQISYKNSQKEFDWKEFIRSIFKGAGIGGLVGLGTGALTDLANGQVKPINTDKALLNNLSRIRLSPEDYEYKLLKKKSDWLISAIQEKYSYDLRTTPYRFGSTEKNTALSDDYDIDLLVVFKAESFNSISDMFHDLLEFIEGLKGKNGIIEVRDQKKSVGVLFSIGGEEKKIDVVPQKATKGTRTSGYLYVNNKGILEKPSRQKTDLRLQDKIKLTETQKKILVVLKEWRNKHDLPISSHLLQYLVLDAYIYQTGQVPVRFTKKVIMVLKYIRDNIHSTVILSIENSNNELTNFSNIDKDKISRACKDVIDEYQYQPNSIVEMINGNRYFSM